MEGLAQTLGISHHDLSPSRDGIVAGRVNVVERLGNETIMTLGLLSGDTWLAVLYGDHLIDIGTAYWLGAPDDRQLLFHFAGNAVFR